MAAVTRRRVGSVAGSASSRSAASRDILSCCVDGLTGSPEAPEAVFPITTVQTRVVRLIRNSLKYVPRREKEQVAGGLKPIYTAKDPDQAQAEPETFHEKAGGQFPVIIRAWRNAWEHVIPFLACSTTALLACKIHFGDRVPDTAN